MIHDVSIPAALIAGLVSFLSPCVLPLVPPYLVYLTGATIEHVANDETESASKRAVRRVADIYLTEYHRLFMHFAFRAMAQDRVLRKVDDLYEEYDRGPNGLLLPYITRCYRAVVRPRGQMDEPEHSADLTAAANAVREARGGPEDPATTLIDFR